jgi:predicted phosphoribosyltransferase
MIFQNRTEAGKLLAKKLVMMKIDQPIIYGIPRGGLVVANEISNALKAPLSAIITRKIGHPNNPEYAIGAIAEDGDLILSPEAQIISQVWLNKKIKEKKEEAKKRREYILMNQEPLLAENKTAIIVDDGLATGLSMKLAIKEIKHLKPKRIIIAVTVAASEIVNQIKKEGCELVALEIPKIFLGAIGNYYKSFEQVSDEEARKIFNSKINL